MVAVTTPSSRPLGCTFLGAPPSRIFTVSDFVGDENLMIKAAEDFSRKEILTRLEEIDRQEPDLMPRLIREAGALGLCGVDAPEAYGGLGLSKNLAARILEMMSLNGSFSVTYGITSGISQVGLTLFGTEAQKQQFLPSLTSGESIGAYALSEPNSGSDALSATTRADLRDGKWVLNGTKMWISNAQWADLFLVMAKIDGQQFSAFLVPKDAPGVSISREEHKMGLKGSSTARLILENAEIPAENLLHEPGKGHQVAFNALNIGRFKLASMSVGPTRHAVEIAAAYAADRKQFGQSIASFGLIQQKFRKMRAWYHAAESMIYRTGALIDGAFEQDGGTVDGNRKAAEEYAVECSICKVFATEAQSWITDEALQVFGGYGFTEEFPIARHYRDARVSRIYEGTNEINRLFISDRFRRRVQAGLATLGTGDSFVAECAVEGLKIDRTDQEALGAQSDLLILAYAEQSVRLRDAREHDATLIPFFNARAAEALQSLTGAPIMLPGV